MTNQIKGINIRINNNIANIHPLYMHRKETRAITKLYKHYNMILALQAQEYDKIFVNVQKKL
jgi:hypothetical protein